MKTMTGSLHANLVFATEALSERGRRDMILVIRQQQMRREIERSLVRHDDIRRRQIVHAGDCEELFGAAAAAAVRTFRVD